MPPKRNITEEAFALYTTIMLNEIPNFEMVW
jgi:hypothetical protein